MHGRFKKTKSSLSNRVNLRTGGGFGRDVKTTTYKIGQGSKRCAEALKYRHNHIAGLSFEDRQLLQDLESAPDDVDMMDAMPSEMPPGEEAMFWSSAGGEADLCQELFQQKEKGEKYAT
ncbi:hypothetical protein OBBRIDRAFT_635559 [Obba rivulosa]|uniref:Uncharacterized protein n=1 Tax=Obba rivulosa TaxID=1052685 RepID=A0A8E2AXB9_9APHY|nr:hypothetical protein OBBRIDRAFT_635559 [Obba rivulosa]